MESKLSPQFIAVLQLALLSVYVSATTNKTNIAVGNVMSLNLATVKDTVTRAVWYHQGNMVVDWDGGPPVYFSTFKGRTTLDRKTANLRVENVSPADSGVYTAEINLQLLDEHFSVVVMERVPKPRVVSVTITCNPDSKNCKFTCKADTDAATYAWRGSIVQWILGRNDKTEVLTNEDLKDSEYIFCQVKNAVSEEESDPFKNPMHRGSPIYIPIVATISIAIAVIVLSIVGYKKKDYIKTWFFRKEDAVEVNLAKGSSDTSTGLLKNEKPAGDGRHGNEPEVHNDHPASSQPH